MPASQSNIEWTVPLFPSYEGVKIMKIRDLISVILGCDVCPGGVKNVGPSKVHQKLTKIRASSGNNEEVLFTQPMDYAVAMSKPEMSAPQQCDKKVLTIFVNVIIYQPTSEQSFCSNLICTLVAKFAGLVASKEASTKKFHAEHISYPTWRSSGEATFPPKKE